MAGTARVRDLVGLGGSFEMGIVAGSAPKLAPSTAPTLAIVKLFALGDGVKRLLVRRILHEGREDVLGLLPGTEIPPVAAGIQNADLAFQMALLAHAVADRSAE